MCSLFSPDSTNLFPIKRKWIANDFTEQPGQRNKAEPYNVASGAVLLTQGTNLGFSEQNSCV